jgi:hypothetical protein
MRRRRKRNPDAGAALAAVGGFSVAPILPNLVGVVSRSPLLGAVSSAAVGGYAFHRAQKTAGASRVGYYGGVAASVVNALGWGVLAWELSRIPGPSNVRAEVNGQPAPASLGPSSGAPAQWLAFPPQAPTIPLAPGVRYRAAIDLPFGAGVLATDARVRETAEEMGFSDVQIFDDAGWADADLFVEATYHGAPRWLERSERIVGAWAFV